MRRSKRGVATATGHGMGPGIVRPYHARMVVSPRQPKRTLTTTVVKRVRRKG